MGTDTGGSIRLPAAYCGVVGMKPTYGRLSRRGIIPLSQSLDHAGPLARTVEDCAFLLAALRGDQPVDLAGASVAGFHRQEFRCGAVGEGCGAVDYRLRGRRGLRLEHIANQCAAIAGRPPYAAGDGKDKHYCHDGGDTSVTAFALSAQPVLFHQLLAHGWPLCLDRLVHHCMKSLFSLYCGFPLSPGTVWEPRP